MEDIKKKYEFKLLLFLFLSGALIISIFFFFNNSKVEQVEAGAADNVFGYAWSENIGWISFNSTSGGGSISYGVNIGFDGIFSGYAWSENIGWISFNQSQLSGCPSGTCRAEVNLLTHEVSGWARALAYGDGWDGWIKLRGSGYGVEINDATQEFEGWAWGDVVVGWVSFNCKNPETGNVCSTSNYQVKTSFTFNQLPIATDLTFSVLDYCIYSLPTSFSWTFEDDGTQEYYQVQIDNNFSFSSLEVDSGKVYSSSEAYAPVFSFLYNTTYYWRLKVWDDKGADSGWVSGPLFATPLHAYPYPDFTPSPQSPSVDEVVEFVDSSECYNASGNEYSCKNGGSVGYQWDFDYDAGDGFTVDSTYKGSATTTYSISQPYTVRLRVTDDIGTCNTNRLINISFPLPEWEEVSP